MSSRALTDAVAAAIVAGKVRPVVFVEGAFYDSGSPSESFLRLWSGLGDISWNSTTWTGAGKLLSISPLEESAEVKAVGFNVELSGLPQSILSTALGNVRQGKPGKVWLGLMGREGYLDLPGSSGNYASTPDSAAVSVTGDIDLRSRLSLNDWTPAAEQWVFSKLAGGGSRSYDLYIATNGRPVFRCSVNGTTVIQLTASAAVPAANGAEIWLRATRVAASGDVVFYTSSDGDAWTQLGTTQTGTSGNIFDSSVLLAIGAQTNGLQMMAGKIYYAELRNGIAGTVVACFDPSTDAYLGDTSFTSSTTGEVWTINQSSSPVYDGYVDLPGSNSNYARTPDSAAVSITGDIDFIVKAALTDWTPAAEQDFITKFNVTTNQGCFRFSLLTNGRPFLRWTTDGTSGTQVTANCTAAPTVTDGADLWLRATLDVDNGAAGYDVKFYTSSDGVTWTQLGSTVTGAGVTSIFDSTNNLEVGARAGGVSTTAGKIYYAEIRNGIGGTAVAKFYPGRDAETGDTSFASSDTGETWTVNQSGSPVASVVVNPVTYTTPARIQMDENALLDDPYLVRSGRMDYVSIAVDGETTRITAQYEDRLVDLERSRERRYTDEDQQFEYPGDLGFEFVAGLQDKQLIWGGPGAASSPVATPNYDNGGNDSTEDRRGNYSAYD